MKKLYTKKEILLLVTLAENYDISIRSLFKINANITEEACKELREATGKIAGYSGDQLSNLLEKIINDTEETGTPAEYTGRIITCIFYNEEKKYGVFKMKTEDDQTITIKGTLDNLRLNDKIAVKGIWEYSKRFGYQVLISKDKK